ncbi:MAG: alpha-ketoglutarate-dependent 2,4-dichlorophenoxyacetate dioxygenase [Parasphingorhabdus sp.]|jgi:alpha-ketoglutarate-dependent 2,4-dichlorophenoxyacetate dioxygenase
MSYSPLHRDFGIRITDTNLREISVDSGYQKIRQLFEEHSLLLFPAQHLNDIEQLAFAKLFGVIEDRSNAQMNGPEKISPVSNVKSSGNTYAENDLKTLDLRSNMLWHTDSTFLPVPALANILQARQLPSEGGATEFLSSRAGFNRFDESLKTRLRTMIFCHRYGHSRAQIDPRLADMDHIGKWPDQRWRAVWENPANHTESLYIASHAFQVEGMTEKQGRDLLKHLIEEISSEDCIYTHHWQVGDVIIWDERAVLHRGTPWPYNEARTLASVCVSAGLKDGLQLVTPPS